MAAYVGVKDRTATVRCYVCDAESKLPVSSPKAHADAGWTVHAVPSVGGGYALQYACPEHAHVGRW